MRKSHNVLTSILYALIKTGAVHPGDLRFLVEEYYKSGKTSYEHDDAELLEDCEAMSDMVQAAMARKTRSFPNKVLRVLGALSVVGTVLFLYWKTQDLLFSVIATVQAVYGTMFVLGELSWEDAVG